MGVVIGMEVHIGFSVHFWVTDNSKLQVPSRTTQSGTEIGLYDDSTTVKCHSVAVKAEEMLISVVMLPLMSIYISTLSWPVWTCNQPATGRYFFCYQPSKEPQRSQCSHCSVVLFTLLWLKHHNKHYRDVRIHADELSHLPVNGGLSNLTFVENSCKLRRRWPKARRNWWQLWRPGIICTYSSATKIWIR